MVGEPPKMKFFAGAHSTSSKVFIRTLVFWAALNSIVGALVTVRWSMVVGWPESFGVGLYLGTANFGQAVLVSLLAALLLLPFMVVRLHRNWQLGFVSVVGTALFFLLVLDVIVFGRYRAHLNGLILQLVLEGGTEVFRLTSSAWFELVASVGLLLALQVGIAIASWRLAISRLRNRVLASYFLLGLCCFASTAVMHAVSDANYDESIIYYTPALPLYRLATAKTFMRRHGWTEKKTARVGELDIVKVASNRGFRLPAIQDSCQASRPLNVLILLIDSWRFDLLTSEVTPNIKRFVDTRPVATFHNHLSGGNATRTGVFSLFYGLFGTYWDGVYANAVPPLWMSVARSHGYETNVFSSATLAAPPLERTVFLDMPNRQTSGSKKSPWQRDQAVVDDWLASLKQREDKQPFFTTLFFDSAHGYDFPADYPAKFLPMTNSEYHVGLQDPSLLFNRFKTAVHFIDSQIQRVFEELETRQWTDSTVVLITGDHGEEFDDNRRGYWGHGGNYTKYQIQVPLVLYWPGRPLTEVHYRTTHIDVAPTLLKDLFGCTEPIEKFSNGLYLWEPGGREWFVSGGYFSYAVVEPEHYTAILPLGNFQTFDATGAPLKNVVNAQVMGTMFSEISRFSR